MPWSLRGYLVLMLEYYNTYKNDLVDLGPNLQGTKNGLVVPEYVDIDSIEDLMEKQ